MIQIIATGLLGTLLAIILRKENPEICMLVSLMTGIFILFRVLSPLGELLGVLQETAKKAGVTDGYFIVILKVIAIAYLSQMGAQLCLDAGEGAVAAKIELAGKILIMVVSAPVLLQLLDTVMGLV